MSREPAARDMTTDCLHVDVLPGPAGRDMTMACLEFDELADAVTMFFVEYSVAFIF